MLLLSYVCDNSSLLFGFLYNVRLEKCTFLAKLLHCVFASYEKVETFHLTLLSKVNTSHSTLVSYLGIFVDFSWRSPLFTCTLYIALVCCHVLNLPVTLWPFQPTYLKNLGICRCVTDSSYVISFQIRQRHSHAVTLLPPSKEGHQATFGLAMPASQPAHLSALLILSLCMPSCNATLSLLGVIILKIITMCLWCLPSLHALVHLFLTLIHAQIVTLSSQCCTVIFFFLGGVILKS